MYSLMIVDDDELVRERVRSLIPAEKMGLTLVAQAENGIQALEQFELYRPQIVIMDIQIPLMNGIEAAQKMLEEDPDVKIVVITGYGTLEFARDAIRSGIFDFLLKPINPQELEEVLRKIIVKIQTEADQTLEQQRMERLLERGMPLIRSRYFLSLIQTPPEDLTEEICQQYLNDFGINCAISDVCVAIVVPNYSGLTLNDQISMQSVLEEELSRSTDAVGIGSLVLYDAMQRMIVIAYGTHKHMDYTLEQRISVIRDKLRYLYRFDFRASIGCSVTSFRFLRDSYQSANQALGYWSILGNNNIVNSKNIQKIERPVPRIESLRYGEIMDLLIAEDLQQMHRVFSEYINQLSYNTQNSIHYIRQKTIELLALLLSCAQDLGVNTDMLLDECNPVYVRILSAGNIFDIQKIISDAAQSVIEQIQTKRKDSKNRALRSAKQYIYNNFADPQMDLAKVSEFVNLSPNYLAQLFRRFENCSFTEYLNRVRIEQAQKKLLTTHMRVYEVAEAVGFQNTKYFFQVFKQITGMRPREFYKSSVFEVSSEENE